VILELGTRIAAVTLQKVKLCIENESPSLPVSYGIKDTLSRALEGTMEITFVQVGNPCFAAFFHLNDAAKLLPRSRLTLPYPRIQVIYNGESGNVILMSPSETS
jgi:hypothetical protein